MAGLGETHSLTSPTPNPCRGCCLKENSLLQIGSRGWLWGVVVVAPRGPQCVAEYSLEPGAGPLGGNFENLAVPQNLILCRLPPYIPQMEGSAPYMVPLTPNIVCSPLYGSPLTPIRRDERGPFPTTVQSLGLHRKRPSAGCQSK